MYKNQIKTRVGWGKKTRGFDNPVTHPAMLAVGTPEVTHEIQNFEQISKMRRLIQNTKINLTVNKKYFCFSIRKTVIFTKTQ